MLVKGEFQFYIFPPTLNIIFSNNFRWIVFNFSEAFIKSMQSWCDPPAVPLWVFKSKKMPPAKGWFLIRCESAFECNHLNFQRELSEFNSLMKWCSTLWNRRCKLISMGFTLFKSIHPPINGSQVKIWAWSTKSKNKNWNNVLSTLLYFNIRKNVPGKSQADTDILFLSRGEWKGCALSEMRPKQLKFSAGVKLPFTTLN